MRHKAAYVLLLFPFTIFAGSENNGRGARPIALGNAFVAVADDQWATIYNPAGLVRVHSPRCALFFIPDQFGLKELRTVSAAAAIPFGVASSGIVLEQFGFDLYRETSVVIGVGRSIDKMIAAGVAINLTRIAIDRYGARSTPTIDAGVLGDVVEDIRLGFHWKNILAAAIGVNNEPLPQVQTFGVRYDIAHSSLIVLELEKDIRFPFVIKMGYEQRFLQMLEFRIGLSNNPNKFSVGLTATAFDLEFSYAGYSHAQLGWTHQVEVSFQL